MISLLVGTIASKEKNRIVVLTSGGVGYTVTLTLLHANELSVGSEVQLHTYLRVTDSALDLFGFASDAQRQFFQLLLTVSGVGPKSAMNVLSLGSIDEVQSAIARGDAKYLTAVQGMGKKTAERLVVELKNKVQGNGSSDQSGDSGVLAEVIDGLVALGYSKEDARASVQSIDPTGKDTEQLLREALKSLSQS